MKKIDAGGAAALSGSMPAAQNAKLGERIKEAEDYGLFHLITSVAAGTVGVVAPITLPGSPFDFEIMDVIVRTGTAVTSSTVQVKNNTTAVTDAIISAAAKAITRAGSIDPAQNKFYPQSDPSGYAAAPCNLVDAGGATAAARTVTLVVRKL
jgi:hypothetical protein